MQISIITARNAQTLNTNYIFDFDFDNLGSLVIQYQYAQIFSIDWYIPFSSLLFLFDR